MKCSKGMNYAGMSDGGICNAKMDRSSNRMAGMQRWSKWDGGLDKGSQLDGWNEMMEGCHRNRAARSARCVQCCEKDGWSDGMHLGGWMEFNGNGGRICKCGWNLFRANGIGGQLDEWHAMKGRLGEWNATKELMTLELVTAG